MKPRVVTRRLGSACGAGLAAWVIALGAAVEAAPTAYQTAVLADNPYVYHRLNEVPVGAAADAGANGYAGAYFGGTGGAAAGAVGAGAGSDQAASFPGTGTGATGAYLGNANIRSFGAALASSSYEFVFKTNPGFVGTRQSLFGVFNTGNSTGVEVTLNSQGNDALGDKPNFTRLYVRGDDGDGVGVHFENPALYDGDFHHLVFTFDGSKAGVDAFAAYVDGVPQTLTFQTVNTGGADDNSDPDNFSNFAFDPAWAARNVRGALGSASVGRLANVTLDEVALYATTLSAQQITAHAAAVPEPASLAMLAAAAAGLFARGRRR